MPDSYLFRFDKGLHTIEYFLLGYLLINSIMNKTHYPIILSFILGFLFAVVDELFQSTVFGRYPSTFDIIADTIGLTLSMIFNQSISKLIKR
jgi:VanZ family protein